MRFAALAIALATVAAPAFAADLPAGAVVAHEGDMLRDANNIRLSSVDTVNKDGSVGIIYGGRVVTLPASSLSVANGKLVTSLTKSQIAGL